MRVAVITTSVNRIVGSTYVAVAFIYALKKLGHQVWLISIDKPNDERLQEYYGQYYVRPDKTIFDVGILDALSLIIKKDLFIVNSYADLIAYPFHLNYFHTRPLGVVSADQRLIENIVSGVSELVRSSDSINWCNSRLTQRQLLEHGITAEVVYPPVIPVKPVKGVKRDAIGYFGRIDRNKRIELLLDIAEDNKDIPIIIAGKPEYPYINELIEEIRKRNLKNVQLITDVSHHMKPYVFSKFRVIVHPKYGEPFGLSPLEASHAGALPLLPCNSGAYEVVYGIVPCFNNDEEAKRYAVKLYDNYNAKKVIDVVSRIKQKASFESFTEHVKKIVGNEVDFDL